ncbi:MAG TPA: DJ-1/PfpI family protein, partial [Clostridia bacterium]|nr:DJ-1/PfpI family protein [Clostridia bacterium]
MDVNILLFQNFETLDVFGPIEILGHIDAYRLRFISVDGGVIQSKQGADILTEPINEADHSGILLVPGGQGTRLLVKDPIFIEKLNQIASQSLYCLTVCTGSALLAKTGLLDGRKATSNKRAFDWVKSVSSNVEWITCARWVVDGKFYTSSGVSAGMDMSLGFIHDRFGKEIADETAFAIEYVWNSDKDSDLFTRQQID